MSCLVCFMASSKRILPSCFFYHSTRILAKKKRLVEKPRGTLTDTNNNKRKVEKNLFVAFFISHPAAKREEEGKRKWRTTAINY